MARTPHANHRNCGRLDLSGCFHSCHLSLPLEAPHSALRPRLYCIRLPLWTYGHWTYSNIHHNKSPEFRVRFSCDDRYLHLFLLVSPEPSQPISLYPNRIHCRRAKFCCNVSGSPSNVGEERFIARCLDDFYLGNRYRIRWHLRDILRLFVRALRDN